MGPLDRITDIESLLVANRGEIAARVIRTARDMGLETIAVYADADRDAPHVRLADRAVRLRGATATDTYLKRSQLIDAAVAAGADAIHPGYGFLSEDHAFAAACADAGLVFVGPDPALIARMALKDNAKEAARAAGLPVLPSYPVAGDDAAAWRRAAADIGYPVIVKAVAGGGGRGLRVIHVEADLPDAIRAARREAGKLFDNDALIVERYIAAPRHIEFQVFGDGYGGAIHLFERECSVQRRHQKVIEEAPSVAVPADLRQEMGEASVRLVQSLGYVGAGTIEYLLDDSGERPRFYFLEMNTRLQVEHPVTEAITGLDLVRLQLEVALGQPLSVRQDEIAIRGHAIEARIYAEDPADGFRPSPGELHRYAHVPLAGVRYDDGVADRATVSAAFDPMLSKVIAHGATRPEAIRRLVRALRSMHIHGVATNRDLAVAIVTHPDFRSGATYTDFLDRRPELLEPSPEAGPVHHIGALLGVTVLGAVARSPVPFALPDATARPPVWSPETVLEPLDHRRQPLRVRYRFEGSLASPTLWLRVDGAEHRLTLRDIADTSIRVDDGTVELACTVFTYDDGTTWVNDHRRQTGWRTRRARGDDAVAGVSGDVSSTLPGTVVAAHVAVGDAVEAGDELVVIEAMKMEHTILAPIAGDVAKVPTVGDFVQAGETLVVITPRGDAA